MPSNIVSEIGPAEYPETVNIRGYKPSTGVHIGQIKKALEMLKNAKKPLFLIGDGVNISHANEEFEKLVNITKVPVITTIMGKGAIPTKHPLFIGNVGMHGSYASNKAVNECDVLFSKGTRFNDRVTGRIAEFAPNAKIIHIDFDSASISRNIVVNIPIVADAKAAINELIPLAQELYTKKWVNQIKAWDKEYPVTAPSSVEGRISPQAIFENLNKALSNCFKYAISINKIKSNPVTGIVYPKTHEVIEEKINYITEKEQQDLIKALQGDKCEGIILLGLMCGMRLGEAMALQEKDIDFDNRLININKSEKLVWTGELTKDNKRIYENRVTIPKTKTSIREVPFPSMLVPILKGIIKKNKENKLKYVEY